METEAMPPHLCSPAATSLQCLEDLDDDEAASWDGDVCNYSSLMEETASACPAAAQLCPLSDLLDAEVRQCPAPGYVDRLRSKGIDAAARLDAVDWILKVRAFYGFRPSTAWLAINYLDRFLSSNDLPQWTATSGVWPWHLLSASCLSVAAKMEETRVPLLIDLQTAGDDFNPRRLVFEPKTVRRMELLLMSALRWRMRPVTPFDFLDHLQVAAMEEQRPAGVDGWRVLQGWWWDNDAVPERAAELILRTTRVPDFLTFRPSELCTATVLSVAGGRDPATPANTGIETVLETMGEETVVAACRRVIDDRLLAKPGRQCLDHPCRPRRKPVTVVPPPSSPVGVLEAAAAAAASGGSFDSSSSCSSSMSSALITTAPAPAHALRSDMADSPPNKRRRILDLQCTEESTVLD